MSLLDTVLLPAGRIHLNDDARQTGLESGTDQDLKSHPFVRWRPSYESQDAEIQARVLHPAPFHTIHPPAPLRPLPQPRRSHRRVLRLRFRLPRHRCVLQLSPDNTLYMLRLTDDTGQFIPLEGATPAIGEVGKPEHVEEDRVEVLVLGRARLPATTDAQTQSADAEGVEVGAVLQELKKVRRLDLRVVFSFLRALVNRGGTAGDGAGASVRGGRV